jgi:hypothetical protein
MPEPLDGPAGGAAVGPPKKSRPSSESAGLVCLGAATSAFGGGCDRMGGPVLGLAGAEKSSPNKSTTGVAFGAALLELAACLSDAERSSLAFSWTTFKGYIHC